MNYQKVHRRCTSVKERVQLIDSVFLIVTGGVMRSHLDVVVRHKNTAADQSVFPSAYGKPFTHLVTDSA